MPTLDLIAAKASQMQTNHSILIYGPPKTGKTQLVATAIKIPEIKRIFWFDLENGIETLLHMGLTQEELSKVYLYKLPNTRDNPVGIETMLKVFSRSPTAYQICDQHGKVQCGTCTTGKLPMTPFHLPECTHNDLVVIDSGSELGDSALSATLKGKDTMYKPGWDEYGLVGKWLGDILSVIQQAQSTNFVVITHEIVIEEDINGVKKDKIYPLMGSKAFSMKCAKYFGTVIYTNIKLGKHAAGSGSTYKTDVVTGSRVNALLEKSGEPNMRQILIDGGILKAGS